DRRILHVVSARLLEPEPSGAPDGRRGEHVQPQLPGASRHSLARARSNARWRHRRSGSGLYGVCGIRMALVGEAIRPWAGKAWPRISPELRAQLFLDRLQLFLDRGIGK